MKKLLALLLAAIMALSLCACGKAAANETAAPAENQEPKEGKSEAISVTDMMGRTVELPEPATRIVALTAADCEILYALGAGDLLVGRGEYCDYPAEVLGVPSVQSGFETNIEQIIALEPQLLLMSTMNQTKETLEKLEEAGVRVAESEAQDIDGVYKEIEMIGALVGKKEEAEALALNMKQVFSDIEDNAFTSGETIYFEVSPLEWGLWTAGKGTFMNEVAEMMGLNNCFDDVEGWAEISEEQVLERNPNYIVTISMYSGEGPSPVEEILGRPGWDKITAVRNEAILNLQNNELSRPTPRLAEGAQMLYDFVVEFMAVAAA